MRLGIAESFIHIGMAKIDNVIEVLALEGRDDTDTVKDQSRASSGTASLSFSAEALCEIEIQLAIVVPCKNEEAVTLTGVLRGIPHGCLIILVSNSTPRGFNTESILFERFCVDTDRRGIRIHQQDPGLAMAFQHAGMSDILEAESPFHVRNGKGEAMMIGVVLAKLANRRFIGCVDADNLVPGSVLEYCKVFAAGLHHAFVGTSQPHAMVRITWKSKPKVRDNKLVFEKSGRSSHVVNEWFNRLLQAHLGRETHDDTIQTGNAGEHAMDTSLAFALPFATGYAVEPAELIALFEAHALPECTHAPILQGTSPLVRVVQVRTCGPHFHDTGRGDEHIPNMQAQGLSEIYWAQSTPLQVKEALRDHFKKHLSQHSDDEGRPTPSRRYPPLQTMNLRLFMNTLRNDAKTLYVAGVVLGESDL
ncbi:hypothetical protein HBI23_253400 [Parastagonospora nodorum]|nr:hypothetical protein HBI23_253400 [Parastagonospora nodorum]KAH5622316.1 hypothetical protein HBI51_247350 [Parastagonospora nodorum]KAH5983404.1 hypothetical protein HBI84_247320 [Parastagonospora nodorum]KAH6133528.1 hypothetical protein HBI68_252660 [Parastagonospora nodorum]KAH6383663.1 hypothetical protein HBI60_254850 [Parastagonospora nodorum]